MTCKDECHKYWPVPIPTYDMNIISNFEESDIYTSHDISPIMPIFLTLNQHFSYWPRLMCHKYSIKY